jgi:hypothetical protein
MLLLLLLIFSNCCWLDMLCIAAAAAVAVASAWRCCGGGGCTLYRCTTANQPQQYLGAAAATADADLRFLTLANMYMLNTISSFTAWRVCACYSNTGWLCLLLLKCICAE